MTGTEEPKRADELSRSVGLIPSGLFIVCALDPATGKMDGYLASWIQQVSFSPLLISLAVRPGRPAYDCMTSGKVFSINVVGEHDRSYLKHFWQGYSPDRNPFSEISHRTGDNGGIIIEKAKAVMECRMLSSIRPGDHEVLIAEVLGGRVLDEGSRPVTHVRKSGLDY